MTPSDIGALVEAADPAVSPDGRLVAFSVRHLDPAANEYRSRLWWAPADGSGPAEPLTEGARRDAHPAWSPDGRWLAFTSHRGDEGATTVHLLPVARPGEAVALTSWPETVDQLRWSPDGRWLSFVARVPDPHAAGDDDRRPPRRVTRLLSRLDDVGWTLDRPQHVHLVGTPLGGGATGVVRDLTPGRASFSDASWLPDSSGLVAVGDAHETWDLDLGRDLYRLDLAGDGPVRVTTGPVALALPAVAADGARVAVVGVEDPEVDPQNGRVGVVDLASGALRWLDPGVDRTWHAQVGPRPPIWLDDDHVLLTLEDRGDQHVWVVDVTGAPAVPLVTGERVVGGQALAGGTLALQESTATRPGEIVALDPGAGERGRVDGRPGAPALARHRRPGGGRPPPPARPVHGGAGRGRRVGLHARGLRPRRRRPLAGARERARRALRPVRQPLLRRGPGAGGRRLRGGALEPAGVVRARAGLRPGHRRAPVEGRAGDGLGLGRRRRRAWR